MIWALKFVLDLDLLIAFVLLQKYQKLVSKSRPKQNFRGILFLLTQLVVISVIFKIETGVAQNQVFVLLG